jgi:serine acetyltransferase
MEVPSGLAGARGDFAHFCRVHRANDLISRLLLPLRQPALFALWTYRYGRWVHYQGKRRRLHSVLYRVLFEIARHATGILIPRWTEIGENVWIESHHPAILCGHRIGRDSFVFGGVTLGVAGAKDARGVPSAGERVVFGPGTLCVGPVEVPSDTVLAPNAVVIRSLPKAGTGWIGSPVAEYAGAPEALVPAIGGSS